MQSQSHKRKHVLLTGGSGTLGQDLQKHFGRAKLLSNVKVYCPSSKEFDVTSYDLMRGYLDSLPFPIEIIIHAAAFVSTVGMKTPEQVANGIKINVIGTGHLATLCLERSISMVYISTDYVFSGDKEGGLYHEDDPTFPKNSYGWSKLGGECVVRMLPRHLIIRCPFGPNVFPYENAFTDQYTSRQPVRNASRDVAKLLELYLAEKIDHAAGVIHIGGDRLSVYDYAVKLTEQNAELVDVMQPELGHIEDAPTNTEKKPTMPGKMLLQDVSVGLPRDCSLDCSKFKDILWRERANWLYQSSPR